jgi:hypothetical protein
MLLTSEQGNITSIQIITIILSVVAILVSIASLWVNFKLNNQLNHKNTMAKIYQSIFNQYLLKKFPKGLSNVLECKSRNEIPVARLILNNSIKSCLKDINFFVIQDKTIYNQLRLKLIEIDETLYSFSSPHNDFEDHKKKLTKELGELYNLIFDKYKKG